MKLAPFWLTGLFILGAVLGGFYVWRDKPDSVESTASVIEKRSEEALDTVDLDQEPFAPAMPPELDEDDVDLLRPPEDKQAEYLKLQTLSLPVLWQQWKLLLEQERHSSLETAALVKKLRQGGVDAKTVYTQVSALLKNASFSLEQHIEIIRLLGEISTPESLEILAKTLLDTDDSELRDTIAEAIRQGPSGLSEWELKLHPELSPILEALWQKPGLDPDLTDAIAARIMREGAESGLKLMLEQIGQQDKTSELTQVNNPRTTAVLLAMDEARNPLLIPLLNQIFQAQPVDSVAFYASGKALAAIATVDSAKILLTWARQASDEAAGQAGQWLGDMAGRAPDTAQYLRQAISQDDSFQSTEVKQGIIAVMEERD